MLIPLLAALTLVAQAPAASPDVPITVLLAPPDAAGVPGHITEFAQEHVAEQLKARGLEVVRVEDVTRKLPASKRRPLLRCKRTQAACIVSLGTAAKTEVVVVTEVSPFLSGYRTGLRAYTAKDGALLAEHQLPGVREDQLLDGLSQSLDVVVPRVRKALRAEPPPPAPVVEKPVTPPPSVTPLAKPLPVQPPPSVETASSGPRRWAWIPAVGGAVLAGVGTVFLLQANDKFKQLDTGGSTDNPIQNPEDVADSGKRAQTLGVVGVGLGVAGLATGAVMYLWPKSAPVRPSVTVGPGGGGVGVAGTWQ